ncbi:MAG: hypothetical protein E7181_05140 [Erysipelotrichaceae bacterium]|nr:hypothetical protein [Erysipelotrichaceae bacterium]
MSKEIKKREGFFRLFRKYGSNKSYEARQEELGKEEIKLDRKDRWALFFSAFLTLFLPALLILGLTILLALLFFRIIPWQ